MPENDQELTHPRVRFERSDIAASEVVLTGFGSVAGILLLAVIVYFAFNYLSQRSAAMSPAPLPMEAHGTPLPPYPRIQVNPRRDLAGQIAYENSVLRKYQWVDKAKGVVGLPIERAMELIAQRGIPPQKAPASLKLFPPESGSRLTGFEGKVEPEPR